VLSNLLRTPFEVDKEQLNVLKKLSIRLVDGHLAMLERTMVKDIHSKREKNGWN